MPNLSGDSHHIRIERADDRPRSARMKPSFSEICVFLRAQMPVSIAGNFPPRHDRARPSKMQHADFAYILSLHGAASVPSSVRQADNRFRRMVTSWHGNGKQPQRSFAWSPRPRTRPLRAWPERPSPIPASSTSSGTLPDRPHAISSNRRRPGCQVAASRIEEAVA